MPAYLSDTLLRLKREAAMQEEADEVTTAADDAAGSAMETVTKAAPKNGIDKIMDEALHELEKRRYLPLPISGPLSIFSIFLFKNLIFLIYISVYIQTYWCIDTKVDG